MNKSDLIAVYPGSFDPITLGHLDIIQRALKFVDKLIIGIGNNINKPSIFLTTQERKHLVELCLKEELPSDLLYKVEVKIYSGLLMHFVEKEKAKLIIRGLRALSDFDFEFNLAGGNQILNSEVETIFLMTSINKQFISSKLVKEINSLGGDISNFIPKSILHFIQNKKM